MQINFLHSCQVLPSIKEKHDEFMLKELVNRWVNHSVMVQWMSRFFAYLDRFFISRKALGTLEDVGLIRFRELVSSTIPLYLSVQKCCIHF